MKTITQYRPMIFTALMVEPARRRSRRARTLRRTAFSALALYILLSLGITADTGLAVWNWQFWLIFTPLFLLGEKVLRQVAARGARPAEVPVGHAPFRPAFLSVPAGVQV